MSSGPNWWEIIKQLFGESRANISGEGGNLLQPDVNPTGLNAYYTQTGSYINSGLKEAFNDPQFYYVDDAGHLQLVRDTSRIMVIKRAYNDGTVGIVFRDQTSGRICNPRGVEFNSNVVDSTRNIGEYQLRNGGSVDGTSPSNIIWNSRGIDYVSNIMANSVTSTPSPPTPGPGPSDRTQKTYTTTQLGKLSFRFMQGNASVLYNGDVVVTQIQLSDGGYALMFTKPDGTELMPSTFQGSGAPDIQSFYKQEMIDGVQRRVLYISPGGLSGFEWLDSNYEGSRPPPVTPPDMNNHTVDYNTSKFKYWFQTSNGQYYTGAITVEYNFSGGNYYWTRFKTPDGQYLTLYNTDGGRIGVPGWTGTTPSYKIIYHPGNTFLQDLDIGMGGSTPDPPSPDPVPPSGYSQLKGDSNSAWKFLRVKNQDGSVFTGSYYIQYEQRSFTNRRTGQPEYDLQVANLTCFTIDSSGNKVYLNVDWGEVNFQNDSSNPIYDSNGNIIGETYNMTLPNNTSGAGSLEEFLTQFYSNNNEYPDPPPNPNPVETFDTNTQTYKITFTKVDGERYTGAIKISYQFAGGEWQFSVETADGNDTLRLEGDGVTVVGRHDGNPIYGLEYEDGVSFEDSFDGAYEGTPPAPGPDPGPVDPTQPRAMGSIESEAFAVVWTQADGTPYVGEVQGYYVHARASDNKQVVYFTDSDGNPLLASVPDGFTGWSPTLADAPAVHGRRLQETGGADSFEYDVPPGPDPDDPIDTYAEADEWFDNGFDVHGNAPPRPFGDSGLTVDGFILYASEEEAFGVQDKIPDELKDAGIIGFINYDGDYEKKEQRYGFTPFDPTDDPLGLDEDQEDDQEGGASESKEPVPEREEKDDQEDDAAAAPADDDGGAAGPAGPAGARPTERFPTETFTSEGGEYCQMGSGRGRRLQACGPGETPDPASHARSESRETVIRELPKSSGKNARLEAIFAQIGKPSNADLLNLEYQERHRYDPMHGYYGPDGSEDFKVEYDEVLQTDNERDLVSMFATFSDASYVDDEHRPQNLFGLNYQRDLSSNNFAVYNAPGNRELVVSIRGTKPSNVVDLMSDALILTGYEDQLSVRFNEDLLRVKSLLDKYPTAKVTLSSHSLGGAINDYIINELKGTPYESRVKAVSFNPGKSPNTKSERSDQIRDFITDAAMFKALKEGDPRYLPIMSSIQRSLNINASDLAGGNLGTLTESQLAQYPELSSSYQQMLGNLRNAETLAERESIAQGWITRNSAFLEGGINVAGSITNLIKTKIYLDLAIAMFDWSTNYTYDQIYKRESSLDQRMQNTRNPYKQLFQDGNNAILKYNSDPISLHHSLLDNESRNVRTYFQEDKRPSLLEEGLIGQLSYGLKSHGIDNFMSEKDKARVNHDETVFESFKNILDDNVESLSGVLNGLKRKGKQKLTEFLEGIF